MPLAKFVPHVCVVMALGIFFPIHSDAGVTIQKAVMVDKTNGGEVTSGMACTYLTVNFEATATTDCESGNLKYKWNFGDGTYDTGASVSHYYTPTSAGNLTPSVTVTDDCGATATLGGLTVSVITDIAVSQIGNTFNPNNNANLCFDSFPNVEAYALPAGVTGSDKIDWYLLIYTTAIPIPNSAATGLSLSQWPAHNYSWGSNNLYISIGGPLVAGQSGEMVLTGPVSCVQKTQQVQVFYDATGANNPGGTTPNWFYYYKDAAGGGAYQYNGTLRTSQAPSGGGVAGIRIANNAYSGGKYIETDSGNSGLLRALGFSIDYHYYQYFCGVLAHETQHATNETGVGDGDGDRLSDAFETGTSNTDPKWSDSAHGFLANTFLDNEVYAGGPVEWDGIDTADTSVDCAYPGSQWAAP